MSEKEKEIMELEVVSLDNSDKSFKNMMDYTKNVMTLDKSISRKVGIVSLSSDDDEGVVDSGMVEMSRRLHKKEYINDVDREAFSRDELVDNLSPAETYEMPYDVSKWVYIPEMDSTLYSSIDILKVNVVGHGWEIVPYKKYDDLTDEEKSLFEKEKNTLEEFFNYPNTEESTFELMLKFFMSREYCGVGAFRIEEDYFGNISSLYYFPAHKLNIRKDGQGFVLESNAYFNSSDKEYFKVFGDKRVMNKWTGEFGSYNKDSEDYIDPKDRADSILWVPIFVPGSPVSGMPRYAPAKNSILGNILTSRLNLDFFYKGIISRLIILVQNGRIDDDTRKLLEEFFDTSKGIEELKPAIIVQPSKKSIISSDLTANDSNKVRIEIVKLLDHLEDATFQKYRSNNISEIRANFGIPKLFYGEVGDITRAAANVIKKLIQHQKFEPVARELESVLNNKLIVEILDNFVGRKFTAKDIADYLSENKDKLNLPSDFAIKFNIREQLEYLKVLLRKEGYRYTGKFISDNKVVFTFRRKPVAEFKFVRPDILDIAELGEVIKNTTNVGAWTPNMVIENFIQRIFPDVKKFDDPWADIPMNMTVMLINSKLGMFAEEESESKPIDEAIKILSKMGLNSVDEFVDSFPDVISNFILNMRNEDEEEI